VVAALTQQIGRQLFPGERTMEKGPISKPLFSIIRSWGHAHSHDGGAKPIDWLNNSDQFSPYLPTRLCSKKHNRLFSQEAEGESFDVPLGLIEQVQKTSIKLSSSSPGILLTIQLKVKLVTILYMCIFI
jgi:hypothetical protein